MKVFRFYFSSSHEWQREEVKSQKLSLFIQPKMLLRYEIVLMLRRFNCLEVKTLVLTTYHCTVSDSDYPDDCKIECLCLKINELAVV